MFPGKTEEEVAELLVEHFNAISSEFQIPVTNTKTLPTLLPYQVAGRIRAFKKPKSMVRGDIFPALFAKFGDLLAIPLCEIYNTITLTRVWLVIWKQEFVTSIPNKAIPVSINDLRNIS